MFSTSLSKIYYRRWILPATSQDDEPSMASASVLVLSCVHLWKSRSSADSTARVASVTFMRSRGSQSWYCDKRTKLLVSKSLHQEVLHDFNRSFLWKPRTYRNALCIAMHLVWSYYKLWRVPVSSKKQPHTTHPSGAHNTCNWTHCYTTAVGLRCWMCSVK